MSQVRIISHIFENYNPRPILTHIFYGPTLKDAQRIENSHMKSDEFFRAAMTTGKYKGIILEIERYIERG